MKWSDPDGREWTVVDVSNLSDFRRVLPLGDSGACYRLFYDRTQVRAYAFRPDESPRAIDATALERQFAGSFDRDRKVDANRGAKIQELYDDRRNGTPRI